MKKEKNTHTLFFTKIPKKYFLVIFFQKKKWYQPMKKKKNTHTLFFTKFPKKYFLVIFFPKKKVVPTDEKKKKNTHSLFFTKIPKKYFLVIFFPKKKWYQPMNFFFFLSVGTKNFFIGWYHGTNSWETLAQVFWIDCGSGKHKKKFLEVERGRERQKLRQKSE